MAKRLVQHGIAALTINLRGHGNSEEDFDNLCARDNIADAQAVYAYAVQQSQIDSTRIGVCTSSYGSVLATALLPTHAVKSLLLRAPVVYTPDMLHTKFPILMQNETSIFYEIQNVQDTPAIQAITNFAGSLFVVASQNDNVVPQSMPKAYVDAAQKSTRVEYEVMPNAPHSLQSAQDREAFTQKMIEWFTKTL
jgi:dipeptidyl aminopeptidase/acylaminoacyl peptidase